MLIIKGIFTPANYSIYKIQVSVTNQTTLCTYQLNENGLIDDGEDVHIFWIDLKNPERTGRQYWVTVVRHVLNTRMINTFFFFSPHLFT